MSEATIKANKRNKKRITSLTEEVIDGGDSLPDLRVNEPISDYNIEDETDTLILLHNKAQLSSQLAAENYTPIVVSDIKVYGEDTDTVKYFEISDGKNGYVVYQIIDMIYYRDINEFYDIMTDCKGEAPGQFVEALKTAYLTDEPMKSYYVLKVDECKFIISAIFSSLTGTSFDVNDISENAKIRRNTGIDGENDFDQSKKADEIKYGTKKEHDFQQEVEDKQKQDGTVGALDQKQEESTKPQLPNVHRLTESQEIEYEVEDKVILDGDTWHVFGIIDNLETGQVLRITREGHTMTVPANKVKPDPNQYEALVINQFDLDEKTRLNKKPENEKPVKMEDLNEQSIFCNIKFDNAILEHTVDGERFKANLKDILEEADPVRVYIGDEIQEVPKDNVFIDTKEWPYAVVASEDDKPVRTIKIDPMSYIDAKDDNDLVRCMIGDKETELPKHAIRVLS